MQFGDTETTKVLDGNGSTETLVEKYKDGDVIHPVRKRRRIRVRVSSQADEQMEYHSFSNQIAHDKSMLDPVFEIEKTALGAKNGFYYVVKCYTQLEY